MNTRFVLLILGIVLIFFSCDTFVFFTDYKPKRNKSEILPGVERIAYNFYCDTDEISNIDYSEYLFWISKIYGDTSIEYRSAFPDTSVWRDVDTCLLDYNEYYLTDKYYKNFPLVGISQEQAVAFSKWRSDRVFELLLVMFGIIEFNKNQTKEMHFSIENYYSGVYPVPKNKPFFDDYPNYRLPTLEEREVILKYNENLASSYFEKCKYKECRKCTSKELMIWTNKNPCQTNPDPTYITSDSCINFKKSKLLHHLKGNVSEWTQEENIAVGGSWKDTRQRILESDTFHVFAPNAWTGFRNVCEWKKWGE